MFCNLNSLFLQAEFFISDNIGGKAFFLFLHQDISVFHLSREALSDRRAAGDRYCFSIPIS
jgi:hypothetical protein